MSRSLTQKQKDALQKHEPQLRQACKLGNVDMAMHEIQIIQRSFINNRAHFRVQKAKNWYYECLLNAGKTYDAKLGFESILICSNENTRIYLEAKTFLGICYLRLGEIAKSQQAIKFVVDNAKTIKSDKRRIQFYRRLIERVEDECILSQLICTKKIKLNAQEMHDQAVRLIQLNKSEEELFEYIGNALPVSTGALCESMCDFSRKQLSVGDRHKLLPPIRQTNKKELGKRATTIIKRVGWKTFCDADSELYKLWNSHISTVFSCTYFAVALKKVLEDWKIGSVQVAVGILAIAFKYTCHEFCEVFKPESLMISAGED